MARIQREAERAALAERDQLTKVARKLSTLQSATDTADVEIQANAHRLDEVDSRANDIEAQLRQFGVLDLDDGSLPPDLPIDPDLLPTEAELREIRERIPDLSLNLEIPDADGDWAEYMRGVDRYIEDHGIDTSRDPLSQLLPADQAARVIQKFDRDFGPTRWDKWDYGAIGVTVLAGTLLDYFLVATPGASFEGKPQRGSPVTSWLTEQSEKLAPISSGDEMSRNSFQRRVAGLTTRAERWAKAPYDVVSPKLDLTPNTHRLAAIGHDPLLGLVFGVKDVVCGTCTFIDSKGVFQVLPTAAAGDRNPVQALATVVTHHFSDVFTAKGLPPPFLSALQALKVNSGFTLREGGDPVSVPNLVRYMYSNGYDLRHFATMAIVPAVAELMLHAYHFIRTRTNDEDLGKEGIRGRLKLAQMLTITHALLASGNIVKTALYGWNPTALNMPQFLWLAKQAVSLLTLQAKRDAMVQDHLAKGWETLLAESESLAAT
jgi:hypothetical protein